MHTAGTECDVIFPLPLGLWRKNHTLKSVSSLTPHCLKPLLMERKKGSSSLCSNVVLPTLLVSFKKGKLKTWCNIFFI